MMTTTEHEHDMPTKKNVVKWSTLPHGSPISLCDTHEATEPGLVQVLHGSHWGYCCRCDQETP